MYNVQFRYGTKANYDALVSKDNNTLYFLTDTLQIFKGLNEYTKSCKLVSTLPSSGQIQGVVYINTTNMTLHVWNGTAWTQLTKETTTTISNNPVDTKLPTEKAVADYVNSKISDALGTTENFVTDVSYAKTTGTLSVTKGANATPVTTQLEGVAHGPSWNSTTRTLTIPVFGGADIVATIGKDQFVSSASYDSTTKKITLNFNDNNTSPLEINVADLVDTYTVADTDSVDLTLSSNEISAAVKVSPKADNLLSVRTVNGEKGLYVAPVDTYTQSQIDTKVGNVASDLSTHAQDTDIHITAAERADWNSKATTTQVATAKSEAISTAASDATSKANAAESNAKSYTDTALTWVEIAAASGSGS